MEQPAGEGPRAWAAAIEQNVSRVIRGKPEGVRLALTALFAGSHLLIEDVPGTGKTMLARAIARSIEARFRRIQCTQDLLPSDMTGVSVFDPRDQTFRFREGPVFTQVLLADEINRATPRAQSALLECMEERQVTCDGETYPLATGFFVIATQNPVELEGTFPLPEAQLDRFALQVRLGYPDVDDLAAIIADQRDAHPIDDLAPVATMDQLVAIQTAARAVTLELSLRRYVARLVASTRDAAGVILGASPRAGLWLAAAARVRAFLDGRDYALPDDVQEVAHSVLDHRLILDPRARLSGRRAAHVTDESLRDVEVPLAPQGAAPGP